MNEILEKLALAKWKEMLHTLSEAEQFRLRTPQAAKVKEIPSEIKARMENKKMKDYFGKDYKIHDYERELEGLERGSNEIIRKIAPDTKIVREIEDVNTAVEHYVNKIESLRGPYSGRNEIVSELKESILSNPAMSRYFGRNGATYDHVGIISKGNLSESAYFKDPTNIDSNWNKYVNKERSLEQRYNDALNIRHEVDEVRARVKNRYNKRFLRDTHGEALNYRDNEVVQLPNTKYVDNVSSNHASPEVLFRESANVAVAPKAVKDVWTNMRRHNREIDEFVPNYGTNAKLNKKQIKETTNKTMRNMENRLNNVVIAYNENLSSDKPKVYSVKPIPLGPVKQSSLRTRYLEKLAQF